MEIYRPLRAILFIYECFRLIILVGIFSFLEPGGGAEMFPWPVYTVPNALFPLMTFFLWRRFSRSTAYTSLYASGKCIALASITGFCVFSWQNIYTALYLGAPGGLLVPGSLLFLLAGDLFSTAGSLALAGKIRTSAAGVPAALPAESAGEDEGK
jgi:hypothetical protein